MVELVAGIGDHITLEGSTARGAGDLDGIETIDVLGGKTVLRLSTPEELAVGGDDLAGQFGVDDLIDLGGVAHVGIAYERQRTVASGLQHSEQRVLLLSLGHLSLGVGSNASLVLIGVHLELVLCLGSVSLGAIGLGRLSLHLFGGRLVGLSGAIGLHATLVSHTGVELCQEGNDLFSIIGLPELQVSRTLQELTHALRLTDTRHFDHDAAVLTFELLDVGLHNAELIDTGADHVERVVDSRLHLSAQGLLDLLVVALRRNLALQLLCGEDLGEMTVGGVLVECLDEQRDEVVLAGFFLSLGFLHRLHEISVFLVIGEHVNDIGHGDLEDHVHTTLQIKAEADLCLQTVLIRVDSQVLHRVFVVLLCYGVSQFGSLLVVVARGSRK